jgi:dTDP-4-dehydrorhamnose reductase
MHHVLITGVNGILDRFLAARLLKAGYAVTGTGRGPCRLTGDIFGSMHYRQALITDGAAVARLLDEVQPTIIVHAAAQTQADDCELDPPGCTAINITATRNLLDLARPYCRHVIYVSTDFVFDGVAGPYRETDPVNPISHYGFTKAAAEDLVRQQAIPWTIVRTCLLYAPPFPGSRSNILTWVKNSLENGQPVSVVTDQQRTPTYAGDLARGICAVIDKSATGIFHISGNELLSPYEMAVRTAVFCGLDPSGITATHAGLFSQPARRPPVTGFYTGKAERELDYVPITFAEGLQRCFPAGFGHVLNDYS